jgi:hypothetical protein
VSHPEGRTDLLFFESNNNLPTDDNSREGALGRQPLDFFDDIGLVLFRQEIHVSEFEFDPAFAEKSLACSTMAARAQRIQLAHFHQFLLWFSKPPQAYHLPASSENTFQQT